MTVMTLNDQVTPQGITPSKRWNDKEQKFLNLNPKKEFIASRNDRNRNWQEKTITQGLFYRADNLHDASAYHRNYIEYLSRCWGDHYGAVFAPDILWYMLLCELTGIVQSDPEKYRHLFSEHKEKQTIIIVTQELVVMPLGLLIDSLKGLVPTDTDKFLPEFSTSSLRSRHAFHAAFADMCSPYYDYMMLTCSIPAIDVRGEREDWELLKQCWRQIKKAFGTHEDYFARVEVILNRIIALREDPSFWKSMYYLQKCGSGSQVEVYGWITDLFLEKPTVAYPKNFPSNISQVKYSQINTGSDYEMHEGLFFSKIEGDFLVPNYGYIVLEKLESVVETYKSVEETGTFSNEKAAVATFNSRVAELETAIE